jgi:DNA-3-methyladenine glycosylase II
MNPMILQKLSEDPRLATILPLVTLPILETSNDIYRALLEAVVSQQLSVKAADTIFKRFLNLFEGQNPMPERILTQSVENLRSCGLSGQKASYIQNIATFWQRPDIQNRDWLSIDNDLIINELTTIKGVGKWTVEMILMFKLGRLDVFPVDDLGIQQAMIRLYGLESKGKELKKQLYEISEFWRPYRSVASRYLWRWKDGKHIEA